MTGEYLFVFVFLWLREKKNCVPAVAMNSFFSLLVWDECVFFVYFVVMLVRRRARCWWMPSRCKTPMQVGELVVVVLQFVIFVAGSCCSCSRCSCCLLSVDGMTCFIPGMILPLSLPLLPYLWLSLSGPFLYSCLSPTPFLDSSMTIS